MQKILHLLLLSLLVLLFSGCTSLTFTGIYHLVQIEPFNTEPEQLKVAVRTHRYIKINNGDVVINLSYRADDLSLNIEEKYLVNVVNANSLDYTDENLVDGKADNESITIMALSQDDAKSLLKAQQQLRDYQATGKKGNGSIRVSIENLCYTHLLTQEATEIDMFLHTNKDVGYFLFLEDLNLAEQEITSSFCQTAT